MPVLFTFKNKEYKLEGTITVKEAFKRLDLSQESYFMLKDGILLNENDILRNNDKVKIVAVISGG